MNVILSIIIFLLTTSFHNQSYAERGSAIWINNCGYSYYMTETKDGLPAMFGNTRTFEEAKLIVAMQKAYDDELRSKLRMLRSKK